MKSKTPSLGSGVRERIDIPKNDLKKQEKEKR